MKKIALLTLLAAFAIPAKAEPRLIGQWKSDATLTMRFNSEHAKLEDKTVLFLSQLTGHLTITFTTTTIALDMPDIETMTAEGKKSTLVGFRETHSYRLLGATSDAVAIKSRESVNGKDAITVYNFENPDTMWVYLASAGAPLSLHLREYFVRIKGGGSKTGARESSRP
jgi:hypothetical protein